MTNSPYFDAARRLGAADFGTVASAGLPTSRYVLPQFEERTAYGFKRQDPSWPSCWSWSPRIRTG